MVGSGDWGRDLLGVGERGGERTSGKAPQVTGRWETRTQGLEEASGTRFAEAEQRGHGRQTRPGPWVVSVESEALRRLTTWRETLEAPGVHTRSQPAARTHAAEGRGTGGGHRGSGLFIALPRCVPAWGQDPIGTCRHPPISVRAGRPRVLGGGLCVAHRQCPLPLAPLQYENKLSGLKKVPALQPSKEAW